MFKNEHRLLKQQGFSLVELLIALTINLLVLSMMLSIFIACQYSECLQIDVRRMAANAQTISSILNAEIQKAGYIGCNCLTHQFSFSDRAQTKLNSFNKITGDLHTITIRFGDFPGALLKEDMSDRNHLLIGNEILFSRNDELIISDCVQAESFIIYNVHLQNGMQYIETYQPLQNSYKKNAEIARIKVNRYFIAPTHQLYTKNGAMRSLFQEDFRHRKIEIVDGIDAIKFTYIFNQHGRFVEDTMTTTNEGLVGVEIKLSLSQNNLNKNWYSYVPLPPVCA